MAGSRPIVFLLDVDNTLLDNDEIQRDLKDHLDNAYGRRRPRSLFQDSGRPCSRNSVIETISELCNAIAPSIPTKSSSSRCRPISSTIHSPAGSSRPPLR